MVNLIPFINRPSIRDEGDFDVNEEFWKMSMTHRVITALATAVISLFTVFTCTYPYVKMLVGRLRKQELDEASPTTLTTNRVGINRFSSSTTPISTPGSIKIKAEKPEIENLKTIFWKDHIVKDRFHLPFQVAVINLNDKDNNELIAKTCVDQYIQFKRFDDPNFLNDKKLEESFVKNLTAEIAYNLDQIQKNSRNVREEETSEVVQDAIPQAISDIPSNIETEQISEVKQEEIAHTIPEELIIRREPVHCINVSEAGNNEYDANPPPPPYLLDANGDYVYNAKGERVFADLPPREGVIEQLTTYRTYGEGTCGLHAMLGSVDNKNRIIKLPNPKAERIKLCEGIRNAPEDSPIRNLVIPILEEYYSHPDTAPQGFKNRLTEVYKEYRKDSKSAEEFARDSRVLDAYLKNLEDIHQYLLLEEIHIAALVFNKRVVIYQNLENLNIESNFPVVGYRVFNDQAGEERSVKMWYNGYMHYERIETSSL